MSQNRPIYILTFPIQNNFVQIYLLVQSKSMSIHSIKQINQKLALPRKSAIIWRKGLVLFFFRDFCVGILWLELLMKCCLLKHFCKTLCFIIRFCILWGPFPRGQLSLGCLPGVIVSWAFFLGGDYCPDTMFM